MKKTDKELNKDLVQTRTVCKNQYYSLGDVSDKPQKSLLAALQNVSFDMVWRFLEHQDQRSIENLLEDLNKYQNREAKFVAKMVEIDFFFKKIGPKKHLLDEDVFRLAEMFNELYKWSSATEKENAVKGIISQVMDWELAERVFNAAKSHLKVESGFRDIVEIYVNTTKEIPRYLNIITDIKPDAQEDVDRSIRKAILEGLSRPGIPDKDKYEFLGQQSLDNLQWIENKIVTGFDHNPSLRDEHRIKARTLIRLSRLEHYLKNPELAPQIDRVKGDKRRDLLEHIYDERISISHKRGLIRAQSLTSLKLLESDLKHKMRHSPKSREQKALHECLMDEIQKAKAGNKGKGFRNTKTGSNILVLKNYVEQKLKHRSTKKDRKPGSKPS